MKNLVTILTPCYNGAPHLKRFLDSVLNQTYKNIEIIFVDDGSTDDTKAIFYSYKDKFESKGYSVKYLYQKNAGQAAAINNGLKHVTGKFLTWPDSDDEISDTSVEEKANCLLDNPEYKAVLSQARVVDNDSGELTGFIKLKDSVLANRDLLKDFISEKNIYVTCGCYLIDFEAFKKANGGLDIITLRAGQNWQMLLPMARDYSFRYLPKPLYTYYVRRDSHSHSADDNEKLMIDKITKLDFLMRQILKKLGALDKYERDVNTNYLRKKLIIFTKFNNRRSFNKSFNLKRRSSSITNREILMWITINTQTVFIINWLFILRKNLVKYKQKNKLS